MQGDSHVAPHRKPLGRKAYGSIGHLPQSRRGPKDCGVSPGQADICTRSSRGRQVWVQEKLDGSCVAVALLDGVLHPLVRSGWPAVSSPYEQHRLFDQYVRNNEARFRAVLREGERICGEWLAQAHGTRYAVAEPFVAFDIMRDAKRMTLDQLMHRVDTIFPTPALAANGPAAPETALERLGKYGCHGALDPIEGVVYRVERYGEVEFLAKFVRHNKQDGSYLPEISGKPPVWNWRAAPHNTTE